MRISDWSSDVCSSDLIGKASRVVKGDDVGSRHSDVDHPSFAEMQQVLQHLTLDEAQVALAAAVLVMLLYRFLDLVAKRDFVIVSKQQCTQALPKSAARVARSTFFRHFEDQASVT